MARGVAGETSVTKYGSKSAPEGKPFHFYQWESGTPGEGVGKCKYCACKLKFEPKGPRGGKVRMYWNNGKWSPTEPACKRKAEAKKEKKAA